MTLWQVAAALASAVLHAGWNAAVKAHPSPREAMTAQMVLSALLGLPGFLWTGLPAAEATPWIAASTTLNLVTVTSLLRAYELVGFGLAYPVVRAISVLLVVPLAARLSGEALSIYGVAGVALIAMALLLLAIGNPRQGGNALPRAALLWVLLAGLCTAAYVMCDAQGVRHAGSPMAYGFAVSLTNAAAMSFAQRLAVAHGGAPRRERRADRDRLDRLLPVDPLGLEPWSDRPRRCFARHQLGLRAPDRGHLAERTVHPPEAGCHRAVRSRCSAAATGLSARRADSPLCRRDHVLGSTHSVGESGRWRCVH